MDIGWSQQIPDPQKIGTGNKWQSKVSTWLITSAHAIWLQRNAERYPTDPDTQLNAQRNETEAKLTKAYGLAQTYLTVYDQRELIKETLVERLNLPEPTNRIWVDQIIRIIYSRIRKNKSRPPLPDIRQFFSVLPATNTNEESN